MTGQRKSLTQRLLEGVVTTGLLLFALVPVYWMVSSSPKSDPELSQIEGDVVPPRGDARPVPGGSRPDAPA